MSRVKLTVGYVITALLITACESENDHFCAKYSYYAKELTRPGNLPFRDIKAQLRSALEDEGKDHDQTRIALFVLEDIENDIKAADESAIAFCKRRKRWEHYR